MAIVVRPPQPPSLVDWRAIKSILLPSQVPRSFCLSLYLYISSLSLSLFIPELTLTSWLMVRFIGVHDSLEFIKIQPFKRPARQ